MALSVGVLQKQHIALTGAILAETVFGWPGVGGLFIASVTNRDYPVLEGIFLLSALGVVLVNLATDAVFAWLDPRVAAPTRRMSSVLGRLVRRGSGFASLILVLALLAVAMLGPYVTPRAGANQISSDALSPPSRQHALGTEELGRDVLANLVVGTRVSLRREGTTRGKGVRAVPRREPGQLSPGVAGLGYDARRTTNPLLLVLDEAERAGAGVDGQVEPVARGETAAGRLDRQDKGSPTLENSGRGDCGRDPQSGDPRLGQRRAEPLRHGIILCLERSAGDPESLSTSPRPKSNTRAIAARATPTCTNVGRANVRLMRSASATSSSSDVYSAGTPMFHRPGRVVGAHRSAGLCTGSCRCTR